MLSINRTPDQVFQKPETGFKSPEMLKSPQSNAPLLFKRVQQKYCTMVLHVLTCVCACMCMYVHDNKYESVIVGVCLKTG
jgi:hypothetical protein